MSLYNNISSQKRFIRNIRTNDLTEFVCRFTDRSFKNAIINNLKQPHLYSGVDIKSKLKDSPYTINDDIYLVIEYNLGNICIGHMTIHLLPNCPNSIRQRGPIHVINNRHNDRCQRIRISYSTTNQCIEWSLTSLEVPSRPIGADLNELVTATLEVINNWFDPNHSETILNRKCVITSQKVKDTLKNLIRLRGGRNARRSRRLATSKQHK